MGLRGLWGRIIRYVIVELEMFGCEKLMKRMQSLFSRPLNPAVVRWERREKVMT